LTTFDRRSSFAAIILLEFGWRVAHGADAKLVELRAHLRIDGDLDDGALNLVDDRGWRAGRRHQPCPGRDFAQRRHVCRNRERLQIGQRQQRTIVELRLRAQLAVISGRLAETPSTEKSMLPIRRPCTTSALPL
jgi:hypothetical protein